VTRLLRDAKVFETRLSHIEGAGTTGTYFIQLAEAKQIALPVADTKTAEPEPNTEEAKPGENESTS
jgi:vacuolar protein sorting-associated protein 54